MNTLTWRVQPDGYQFQVRSIDGSMLRIDDWVRAGCTRDVDKQAAVIAPLLRAREAEATEEDEHTLLVPHSSVAAMTPSEVRGLGLPEPSPFMLEVTGEGLVTDASFAFAWRMYHPRGRPVLGYRLTGSLVECEQERFVFLEPHYGLVRALEAFNQTQGQPRDQRMSALADIQARVPADVRLGDYFRAIRLVQADALTLRPFLNAAGEVDFDPVPARAVWGVRTDADNEPAKQGVLPEGPAQQWQKYFRNSQAVKASAPAGDGWYVVLTPKLQLALQAVKTFQSAAPSRRREFLANPRVFLREAFRDHTADTEVDELFWESADYSGRIREVGAWHPRVIPFLRPSGQEWLPPTAVGLRVGADDLHLSPADIGSVRRAVETAIEQGQSTVMHEGVAIPATHETLQALDACERAKQRPADPAVAESPRHAERIALLIHDNLEELGFERGRGLVSGTTGVLPAALRTTPLPHQRDGYEWLQDCWVNGLPGCLLADDMGLGKTLQALMFLAWVREQSNAAPTGRPMLIVAPTGLLKNWQSEHDQHLAAPGLGELLEAYDSGLRSLRLADASRGAELEGGMPVLDADRLAGVDWVLTTFETLRDYQHSFGRIHWQVIVFDEVQKIKNPATLMTEAAKAMNADFVLALTGTPVENTLADLWSIIDAVYAGHLGVLKNFMKVYDVDDDERGSRLLKLKTLLLEQGNPPVVKRRMKHDHLRGLPQIHVQSVTTLMPEQQARAYEEVVEQAKGGAGQPGSMLTALHRLRKVSLHPAEVSDIPDDLLVATSARLKAAFDVLDRVAREGEKCLLFLDDLSVQARLAEVIQRRYALDHPPLLINGSVAGSNRKKRVDIFQSRRGFDVMLLSPRAGGVGLTLTAANHVIHLARWWNPAVEDQCTDRVYRIGQTREVHVYLPLAVHPAIGEHSFDLRLHSLLESKRTLSRTVLAPPAVSEAELASFYSSVVDAGHA